MKWNAWGRAGAVLMLVVLAIRPKGLFAQTSAKKV